MYLDYHALAPAEKALMGKAYIPRPAEERNQLFSETTRGVITEVNVG